MVHTESEAETQLRKGRQLSIFPPSLLRRTALAQPPVTPRARGFRLGRCNDNSPLDPSLTTFQSNWIFKRKRTTSMGGLFTISRRFTIPTHFSPQRRVIRRAFLHYPRPGGLVGYARYRTACRTNSARATAV